MTPTDEAYRTGISIPHRCGIDEADSSRCRILYLIKTHLGLGPTSYIPNVADHIRTVVCAYIHRITDHIRIRSCAGKIVYLANLPWNTGGAMFHFYCALEQNTTLGNDSVSSVCAAIKSDISHRTTGDLSAKRGCLPSLSASQQPTPKRCKSPSTPHQTSTALPNRSPPSAP